MHFSDEQLSNSAPQFVEVNCHRQSVGEMPRWGREKALVVLTCFDMFKKAKSHHLIDRSAPVALSQKWQLATPERCDNQDMRGKRNLGLRGESSSSERAVCIFLIRRSALYHSSQLH